MPINKQIAARGGGGWRAKCAEYDDDYVGDVEEDDDVEEPDEEEPKEEMSYATKEELSAAVEEMKAMIEEIKAMLEPKEDLSADELGNLLTEELAKHEKVELNEIPVEVQAELNEPSAEPIVSNPEVHKTISKFSVSKNRKSTTIDRVMSRLNN